MIKKAKKTNSINSQINTGVLVLENKKVFKGIGIGYQGEATGEEETKKICADLIAKVGANSIKDMGKVMGELKKTHSDE
ncbi:GatB/YqeY domain-containing protein, partial [Pelagibacterales bacterium SAG-MED03]|nr:GatB/YqeY domain-containing protein [Pelagibacterales bacterium SAG-MED03]